MGAGSDPVPAHGAQVAAVPTEWADDPVASNHLTRASHCGTGRRARRHSRLQTLPWVQRDPASHR
jgi:hypothetical protein